MNPFDYMKPAPEMLGEIQSFREAFKVMYAKLQLLPDSRQKSVAITKLEESAMWAIKGLVFNDIGTTTPDNN